jgi:hypothetical protein
MRTVLYFIWSSTSHFHYAYECFCLLCHFLLIWMCTLDWAILQVRLESMDGRVALVPWADMLNHSPEVLHSVFYKILINILYIILLAVQVPQFTLQRIIIDIRPNSLSTTCPSVFPVFHHFLSLPEVQMLFIFLSKIIFPGRCILGLW